MRGAELSKAAPEDGPQDTIPLASRSARAIDRAVGAGVDGPVFHPTALLKGGTIATIATWPASTSTSPTARSTSRS